MWLGDVSGELLGVTGEGSSCPWIEGQLSLSPRVMMTGAEIADSPARYDGPLKATSDCECFHRVIFLSAQHFSLLCMSIVDFIYWYLLLILVWLASP